MVKTLIINKPLGKTPLQVVEQYKSDNPEHEKTKMAYAGRLDPMAEGKLLLLLGEECKQREKYLGLDKEYEFEVLVGMSSDTQDILGLTDNVTIPDNTENLDTILDKLRGNIVLPYPVFSSKTVEGKPLFLWALEQRLSEITIPTKEVQVYKLDLLSQKTIPKNSVLQTVQERIARVTQVTEESKQLGRDFRRKDVLQKWKENIESTKQDQFMVIQLRCVCSSGTYMRTLASMIGQELGSAGLAWSIKRTKIGKYRQLFGKFGIWTKKY